MAPFRDDDEDSSYGDSSAHTDDEQEDDDSSSLSSQLSDEDLDLDYISPYEEKADGHKRRKKGGVDPGRTKGLKMTETTTVRHRTYYKRPSRPASPAPRPKRKTAPKKKTERWRIEYNDCCKGAYLAESLDPPDFRKALRLYQDALKIAAAAPGADMYYLQCKIADLSAKIRSQGVPPRRSPPLFPPTQPQSQLQQEQHAWTQVQDEAPQRTTVAATAVSPTRRDELDGGLHDHVMDADVPDDNDDYADPDFGLGPPLPSPMPPVVATPNFAEDSPLIQEEAESLFVDAVRSAEQIFLEHQRQRIVRQVPLAAQSVHNFRRAGGLLFRSLPPSEKQKYEKAAAADTHRVERCEPLNEKNQFPGLEK